MNGGAERTTRLDTQRLPTRMDGIDLVQIRHRTLGGGSANCHTWYSNVRRYRCSGPCLVSSFEVGKGSNKMTNSLELTA